MVLGKIASPPSAFILLICLCVWSSPKIKNQQPAIALLSNQSADSFDVTMGSASKKKYESDGVSHFTFGRFIILIWILQTHCFVALCMLSHVDGVLIYLQSFDDFHLTGSVRNSIPSWCMWWHLGVQMMGWQKCDDECGQPLKAAPVGSFVRWWMMCVALKGWVHIALSPIGISDEFTLRFWAELAESWGRVNLDTTRLICKNTGCLYFF